MANPPRRSIAGRVMVTKPMTKIGSAYSTDRDKAQPSSVPQAENGAGENRSKYYTYFTKAPTVGQPSTDTLYTGDRLWAKVSLTLITAGPVVVGDMADLVPVNSGKGRLLATNEPAEFVIAKGTRLNIAATGVNRILVQVEPLPWLEQITATIQMATDALIRLATGKRG